ncbi:diaminopimelate decarboxylase [Halobacteroides halobius DSM 5150]|uniref:Diaminopimelate decarboxylase n=1 Tax=Halobacteroides halobius (strain ATCC 35273 / DSM 5150 / MD-1) TaxID=748449 RepID=L0K8Y1_HALHC|nr:diaminopimelate decarboxylase [Halobacteroides halobius]AGB40578.1 diaminopimelate decarboxylase [Halobacteroides halobius DSM 5150]
MKLQGTMEVSQDGILEVAGHNLVDIAEEYGTPLYILDEKEIRDNCRAYREAFEKWYPNSETLYASKAFLSVAMARIIDQEGLGLDVVSGGELHVALEADFPVEKIYFHGNNKTPDEIEMALDAGIKSFVVDNQYELELLNQLAGKHGVVQDILLRVTPGIEAHTHSYIQTGQTDSKFGVGVQNGLALETIKQVKELKNVKLVGLHCHIGSQIFKLKSFAKAIEVMMDFVEEVKEETGLVMEELNLGGGIGIPYTEDEEKPSIDQYAEIVTKTIKETCESLDMPLPKIINEPGRSIVGTAGSTIYRVGSVKQIPNIRKYVAVDGGMPDNIRPALYDAEYEACVVNKADQELEETVTITGKCCESGDILIKDIKLPHIEPGDILLTSCTGAYGYAMSSNYNGVTRPGVLLLSENNIDWIVKPESKQDLISNDVLPERLK